LTISLPPSKVKKILKLYFSGSSQQAIADKLGTSQGSVSHWVSRFDKEATNKGLLNAAKEFGVLEEIVELRALTVELEKGGMTAQEAGVGAKIMRKFKKLGVDPAKHEALVEVCTKVKDPDFITYALQLHQMKMESGLEYGEAIDKYDKSIKELTLAEEKLEKAKVDLQDITSQVEEKKKEYDHLENILENLGEVVQEKLKEFKKQVADKEKEAEVTMKEIEQTAAVKAELKKYGWDIPTFIKLVKEVFDGHGMNVTTAKKALKEAFDEHE
jgi:predicted transcriptional regulator